jgi:UDP-glucose 4-epimerase
MPLKLPGAVALITGGAGCVGSAIADQLVEREVRELIIFDNFTRGRPSNLAWAMERCRVRIVNGDIRDPDAVAAAMGGVDVVFHQAALRVTQCAEDPRRAFEVMVDGTFNVVDAAARAGVRKLIAASSAAVYGAAEVLPTPENHHPYGNRTLYGAAKGFNEALLRSFHEMHGLDYIALRYFNVYGPRMDIEGRYTEVMVRWMERIAQGLSPVILGDGRQAMDFVYVSDVARANIIAATSDVTDEVFNVASGIETSLKELAQMLACAMESELKPEYGPERAVNSVSRRLGDTHKACEMLRFNAEVSLKDGLQQLVSWWRRARSSSVTTITPTTPLVASRG